MNLLMPLQYCGSLYHRSKITKGYPKTRHPAVPDILKHTTEWKTLKKDDDDENETYPIVGLTLAPDALDLVSPKSMEFIRELCSKEFEGYPGLLKELTENLPTNTLAISIAMPNFRVGRNCHDFYPDDDFEIPDDAYFTYQKLSENMQVVYYNENDVEYTAGISYYSAGLYDEYVLEKNHMALFLAATAAAETYPLISEGQWPELDGMYGWFCQKAGKRVVICYGWNDDHMRHNDYNHFEDRYYETICHQCTREVMLKRGKMTYKCVKTKGGKTHKKQQKKAASKVPRSSSKGSAAPKTLNSSKAPADPEDASTSSEVEIAPEVMESLKAPTNPTTADALKLSEASAAPKVSKSPEAPKDPEATSLESSETSSAPEVMNSSESLVTSESPKHSKTTKPSEDPTPSDAPAKSSEATKLSDPTVASDESGSSEPPAAREEASKPSESSKSPNAPVAPEDPKAPNAPSAPEVTRSSHDVESMADTKASDSEKNLEDSKTPETAESSESASEASTPSDDSSDSEDSLLEDYVKIDLTEF